MILPNFLFIISVATNNNCTKVKLQTNPQVNLTEYIRASWYIQQQQLTSYQRLNDLYCVTATYNKDQYSHVPFFKGEVISVYNYANRGKVNGPNENNNSTVLCARVLEDCHPEKLAVAPCFLPNIFSGPYNILAVGPHSYHYEWAIVIGGQPTEYVGNNTCTTSEDRINNSGLWLFSRSQHAEPEIITKMYDILSLNNVSTKRLNPVYHTGCNYTNAYLKY